MLRLIFVFALLITSGCVQMLEPGEPLPPRELPVQFQSVGPVEEISFAVAGGPGSIIIRDRAITGVCHARENYGAYRREGTVTFWVAHTGQRGGDICPAIGKLFSYQATVQGLEPGTYTIRVEYIGQVSTDTYPRPDLEQQVTVQ